MPDAAVLEASRSSGKTVMPGIVAADSELVESGDDPGPASFAAGGCSEAKKVISLFQICYARGRVPTTTKTSAGNRTAGPWMEPNGRRYHE